MQVDRTGRRVTATMEEIALYSMVLSEAICELLVDKGVLTSEEIQKTVETFRKETSVRQPWKQ